MRVSLYFAPIAFSISLLSSCGPRVVESTFVETAVPESSSNENGYLKAHLRSGEVLIFNDWQVPQPGDAFLAGRGTRFTADRVPVGFPSEQTLALDSIVLLESDRLETVGDFGAAGLMVFSTVAGVISVVCLGDPKSCFGSCPTFYALDDTGTETLVAEGFSSSFAKVLEAQDIDALPDWLGDGRTVSLIMRNEAHETHAVRHAALLAVPKGSGLEGVLATPEGALRPALRIAEVRSCTEGEGATAVDCTGDVSRADAREFFTPASDSDLAERQHLYLDFAGGVESTRESRAAVELGVVVTARQTLLSTFLFYQSIAYLGSEAGGWLAALERGGPDVVRRSLGLATELGDIEVQIESEEGWRTVGVYREAGPIASDRQTIPLGVMPDGDLRVRLRMARGHWRVDQVALAVLGAPVEPVRLEPMRVEPIAGTAPNQAPFGSDDQYLVTQRGDAYRLTFDLADAPPDAEFFLDTRGYYYEWMRGEWAAEENPALAALILSNPRQALRFLAPAFKEREAEMESTFWASRFRREP